MGEVGKRCAEEFRKQAHIRDITYDAESRRTGVCRQSFIQYEHGIHEPTAKVLQKLAEADYDIYYILLGRK